MDTLFKNKMTSNLLVLNRAGIHLRAAKMICEFIKPFHASAKLLKRGLEADCRSVLEMLGLGAEFGEILTLSVEGEDASDAHQEIVKLFANQFYEDEIDAATR